jgi:hypothetical protein
MPRTYIRRNGERVRSDLRTRVPVPKWVDPYFFIQGSSIEKMVMTEFVRRGIYFEHTPQTNPLSWSAWMFKDGKNPRKWEPDFLLPQYKIWLEIQGAYFHTLPGQVETDALRFAYIESVGWKPIAWWEDDIRVRLQDLFNKVPEFYRIDRELERRTQDRRRNTLGLPFYEGGTGVDHLAGLRAALRGRARPPQNFVKRYQRKRRPK